MKILFTSAIIPKNYDERKLEYIDSFNSLKKYVPINDIINIECYLKENSYLENYFKNIFYSKTDKELNNKGVKESLALKEFLNNYNISDDEMIIKHTGRYKFLSNFFIKSTFENVNNDVFVRIGQDNQYFFGTFSIKYKFFKNFINNLDFVYMENNMINIEKEFYNYINDNKLIKIEYNNIDVWSKINNETTFIW